MSFRAKLLQAIMALVVATTVISLLIAQQQNSATHKAVVDELFRYQLRNFQQEQEARLAIAAKEAQRLADSVRLFAALEENDPEVYKIAGDELRLGDFAFFRLLNARGEMIAPSEERRAGLLADSELRSQLIPKLTQPMPDVAKVQVGFVQARQAQDAQIFRILAIPITNFGNVVGTLILGQLINGVGPERTGEQAAYRLRSAFWLDGRLIGDDIPATVRGALPTLLGATPTQGSSDGELTAEKIVYRYERFLLNEGSSYPPAYLVSVFSLADFQSHQRLLAIRIALTGFAALLLAALVGRALSRQLAGPIANLVEATRQIKNGHYDLKLPPSSTREMNTLAESF